MLRSVLQPEHSDQIRGGDTLDPTAAVSFDAATFVDLFDANNLNILDEVMTWNECPNSPTTPAKSCASPETAAALNTTNTLKRERSEAFDGIAFESLFGVSTDTVALQQPLQKKVKVAPPVVEAITVATASVPEPTVKPSALMQYPEPKRKVAPKQEPPAVLTDPAEIRKWERIMRNRKSAFESRERKKVALSHMEVKVNELEEGNNTLNARVASLESENNVLKEEVAFLRALLKKDDDTPARD
eukprot:GFYU01000395.1.p1 GENE.GFYU01000395.1~~GFYU01000395.1.p1  ORF type:complete len:244 (-),score=64.67 GFYU01000395.1:283-1014(-)